MSYTITEKCNGCDACVKFCPVDAISGERKQLHTIDDKLCIECGACGRICPEGAVKDARGGICVMIKLSQWPKPVFDKKICTSCNICIESCPVDCLALSAAESRKNPHGYPYMHNAKACIACGFCARECPVDAVAMAGG